MDRLQVREHEDFAMFLSDHEGRITSWNRGVEQTFEYKQQDSIGRQASLIFTEDRTAGIPEVEVGNAAEQGAHRDIRWHLRNPECSR